MAAPVAKDQELELHVDSLAYGGNGVARLNGFVVFVRRGLPGDTVRARVTKVKRNHAEAVADMALDMLAEVNALNLRHEWAVSFRIGANTGPAMAAKSLPKRPVAVEPARARRGNGRNEIRTARLCDRYAPA